MVFGACYQKINEAGVKIFEKAARLVVKMEHAYDTTAAQKDQEDIMNNWLALKKSNDLSTIDLSDYPSAVSVNSQSSSGSNNLHLKIFCYNCKSREHIQGSYRAAFVKGNCPDRLTQRNHSRGMNHNSEIVQYYEFEAEMWLC